MAKNALGMYIYSNVARLKILSLLQIHVGTGKDDEPDAGRPVHHYARRSMPIGLLLRNGA
jgi:hypothetical protein